VILSLASFLCTHRKYFFPSALKCILNTLLLPKLFGYSLVPHIDTKLLESFHIIPANYAILRMILQIHEEKSTRKDSSKKQLLETGLIWMLQRPFADVHRSDKMVPSAASGTTRIP
jgi:hypothetical protein